MTSTDAEKLLPCPFCGKQPRSGFVGADGPDDDFGYWSIECCAAFVHEDDEAIAAKRWNTRAPRQSKLVSPASENGTVGTPTES